MLSIGNCIFERKVYEGVQSKLRYFDKQLFFNNICKIMHDNVIGKKGNLIFAYWQLPRKTCREICNFFARRNACICKSIRQTWRQQKESALVRVSANN
jgi:hypothetical protein